MKDGPSRPVHCAALNWHQQANALIEVHFCPNSEKVSVNGIVGSRRRPANRKLARTILVWPELAAR